MAQSHHWTNVPSMDGASVTVGMVKMQEWCAKVVKVIAYAHILCVYSVDAYAGATNIHWGTQKVYFTVLDTLP